MVTQLTRRAPLPLRISNPLPRFNKSCSRSCVNTFFQEAARRCHVSTSQVIRVFNEVHIPRPSHLPRVLSIDECKGNAAGQKYQVIITDSEAKRIMDILPARTTNGFTEGCNNKIKVVKRSSFGLRNFERFRHRILYINTRNEKGHALSSVHVLSRSA